jgi:hypothetical protein
MSKKQPYDEPALIYLGQRLSVKETTLRDYACNKFSDLTSLINRIMKLIKNPKAQEGLESIKEDIIDRGTAMWISENADILTELAMRTGRTYKVVSERKGEPQK